MPGHAAPFVVGPALSHLHGNGCAADRLTREVMRWGRGALRRSMTINAATINARAIVRWLRPGNTSSIFTALRDLIVARDSAKVVDVMRRDPPCARAKARRETEVEMMRKDDVLALPVLNGGDKLAAIVTCDDAMEVARESENISLAKTSAPAGLGTGMLSASDGLLYRKRVA